MRMILKTPGYFALTLVTILLHHPAASGSDALPIQALRFYAGVTYAGRTGKACQLQSTTNLNDPASWVTLTNVIVDPNRLFILDLDSPQNPMRFYRIVDESNQASNVPAPSLEGTAAERRAGPFSTASSQHLAGADVTPITEGWGTIIDPNNDCQVHVSDGRLCMNVPGTGHDFAAELKIWNAPRFLRAVSGDFILQVKVRGNFNPPGGSTIPGRHAYHGAGILLLQDNANHLSLQRGSVASNGKVSHYANFELRSGPNAQVKNFEFTIPNRDTFLRVARQGNKILAMISEDAENWRAFNPLTVDFPEDLHVGLEAISSSKTPLECCFSDLMFYTAQQKVAH